MRYLGGKSRVGKQLAEFILPRQVGPLIEPFCGGLWVTQLFSGARVAADKNKALITLYKSCQLGWEPPTALTEDEYAAYKETQDEDDPMTAFVGVGCSFGGKWFGGYARDPKSSRNYVAEAARSLSKKIAKCRGVYFTFGDYTEHFGGSGATFYLDPPYAGTTGYKDSFDSARFWADVRDLSKTNRVFVSEYAAPEDFEAVLELETKTDLGTGSNNQKQPRIERLFCFCGGSL